MKSCAEALVHRFDGFDARSRRGISPKGLYSAEDLSSRTLARRNKSLFRPHDYEEYGLLKVPLRTDWQSLLGH